MQLLILYFRLYKFMLYLGGALVYWLWETTHVQEVVGLNPGMDMTFSHWFVVKFVLFVRKDENERKRGHVGPFFRDSCYIKFDNGAQLLSGLTALPTVPHHHCQFLFKFHGCGLLVAFLSFNLIFVGSNRAPK